MTTNILQHLTQLVNKDLHDTESLYTLLEDEKNKLAEGQFSELGSIANNKQQLVKRIEATNNKKSQLITDLKQKYQTEDIMPILIKNYGQKAAQDLKRLNQALDHQLEKCQKLNAVNGQVIVRSIKHNQELIAIVTGQTQKNTNSYNAQGKVDNLNAGKNYYDKV